MNKSTLVKIFGFPATLIHGDTLVLDRWLWLKKRLPITRNGEKLLDVGCGSGAFTIGASIRGYQALGLSWDERNNRVATERAGLCKTPFCKFEVFDVRNLGSVIKYKDQFDYVVNFENIEHLMDDKQLFQDIANSLKPGGRLLLTTPYLLFKSLTSEENGPFPKVEDGRHVRRGYTEAMLNELCDLSGLKIEKYSFCSGFLSQKITRLQRILSGFHPALGWLVILPLRILPPIFDKYFTRLINWPFYSICLEAYKPRFKM